MKIETFKKAKELQDNIESLKKIINDVEKEHHWISMISACCKNECFSDDFYKSLLEFAKQKLAEYEKAFEDLKEGVDHE